MANKKLSTMTRLQPLGQLMPGASFATVSIPITTNIQPVTEDPNTPKNINRMPGVQIQAHPDNNSGTGRIYICNTAAGPDLTNWTNVIAILQPGDYFPKGTTGWAAEVDINTLFIGADGATSYAIGFFNLGV